MEPTSAPPSARSEARFVAVGAGDSLAVTEYGAAHGPAVVVLPALVGSAAAFARVAEPLAEAGYRVIILDPLGMGRSPRPAHADYTLIAQAHRIQAALEALTVHDAVLVAQGVSASIGWRLAANTPTRIAAIVSIEGGIVESQATPGLTRVRWLSPLANTPLGRQMARSRFRAMLARGSASDAWITDRVVDRYLDPVVHDLRGALTAWSRMAESTERDRTAASLALLRCPVIVLLGGAPGPRATAGGVTAAELVRLRTLVPHLVVDHVANSGWFVHEEQPAAVVAAVRALRDVSTATTAGR